MKIVHVVDYYQPQLGYQEYGLAKAQVRAGHEVFVITSDRYFPFKNYNDNYRNLLGERILSHGKEIIDGITIIRHKPIIELGVFTLLPQIKKELIKIKPDIVIQHNLLKPNTFFTLKSLNKLGFRLILDSHAAYYNSDFNSIFKKFYLFIFNTFLSNLIKQHKVISTGIDEKEFLKKHTGLDSEVIPLGADDSIFFKEETLRTSVRNKLGVSKDEVLLIHIGKLNQEKRTDWIVSIYNRLKTKHNKLKLLLIGEGDIDYGGKDIIKFDFVENHELNSYLNAGDIGIWPGSKSNIFIEAIATGLPIILGNYGFSEELISDNGFIIKNQTELEKKIEILINNTKLRNEFSRNAIEKFKSKYSWDKISERFLE